MQYNDGVYSQQTFGLTITLEPFHLNNYRPQRSWGKVIFSQASVILSTGGGVHGCWGGGLCSWGVCMAAGGVHGCGVGGKCVVARGACMVAGGCAWLLGGMRGCWGACVVAGGMHGCRGHVWLQGGMHGCQGGHVWLLVGVHVARGACVVARGAYVVLGVCQGGVHGIQ